MSPPRATPSSRLSLQVTLHGSYWEHALLGGLGGGQRGPRGCRRRPLKGASKSSQGPGSPRGPAVRGSTSSDGGPGQSRNALGGSSGCGCLVDPPARTTACEKEERRRDGEGEGGRGGSRKGNNRGGPTRSGVSGGRAS